MAEMALQEVQFVTAQKPCSGIGMEIQIHPDLLKAEGFAPPKVAKRELRKFPDYELNVGSRRRIEFNQIPAYIFCEGGKIFIIPCWE